MRPVYALRAIVRAAIVFPAILLFLVHGFLIRLFVFNKKTRTRLLTNNVSAYSSFALMIMGVRVHLHSHSHFDSPQANALIVCNHLSYLDMMVLASVRPSVFITSVDMGQVFFLGTMAEIGGSLFIERRNRSRINYDVDQIVSKLQEGFDVTLFPEGTSTNGEGVLPFKKGLLGSAALAGRPILPVTLRYFKIDQKRLSSANRDIVCWYGEMPFLSHFLKLMSVRSVYVDLYFHRAAYFNTDESRDVVAQAIYTPIATAYGTPLAI